MRQHSCVDIKFCLNTFQILVNFHAPGVLEPLIKHAHEEVAPRARTACADEGLNKSVGLMEECEKKIFRSNNFSIQVAEDFLQMQYKIGTVTKHTLRK